MPAAAIAAVPAAIGAGTQIAGAIGGGGESGYRPSNETMSNMEKYLLNRTMGANYDEGKAFQEFSKQWKPANWIEETKAGHSPELKAQLIRDAWSGLPQEQKITFSPKQQAPQFTYKPGESGYDFMKNVNIKSQVEPYYAGIAANQTEAAKSGAQAGMANMMSMLGSRGITGGGIAQMGGGQMADALSRQMAEGQRNVDFQKAQDMTRLAQWNAENYLRGLGAQQQSDVSMRGEKMGYYRQPQEDLMRMYSTMMAPSQQYQPGWGDKLTGMAPGFSALGKSMGSLLS